MLKEVLLNEIVKKESKFVLNLSKEKKEFENIYFQIKDLVKSVDSTLERHTEALEKRHIKSLSALEKKMFRAEKENLRIKKIN